MHHYSVSSPIAIMHVLPS